MVIYDNNTPSPCIKQGEGVLLIIGFEWRGVAPAIAAAAHAENEAAPAASRNAPRCSRKSGVFATVLAFPRWRGKVSAKQTDEGG